MRNALRLSGAFLFLFASFANAQSTDTAITTVPVEQPNAMQFYASDKTAEITYERGGPVASFNSNRSTLSFLYNESRDIVLSGAMMYDVEPEFFSGLTLSFGGKIYAGLLALENTDVIGLAASIEAAYQLPVRQFPLKLRANANYAPDVLTFGNSDRIIDWGLRGGLALTSNVEAFLGVRFLQFDTRPGDRELDKRGHLGIRWNIK